MTNLVKKASVLVANPHHPASDQDLEVDFVKLASTDDISGEEWNVVGVWECAVLPVLTVEEDGAAALDAHH